MKFAPWTDENQDSLVKFVLLYQAFLGTADNPNRSRNLEETRTALGILDAMSAISDVINPGTPKETRILKREGGELKLTDSELKLLQRFVDTYAGQVPFALAKTTLALKDELDAIASQ